MAVTTKFADSDTTVSVLTFDDNRISKVLKPAVYAVAFNPMSGFFLQKRGEQLEVPERVYGSVDRKINKILTSFDAAHKSFGVLLSGDKGSGKTMTSSMVANRAMKEMGIPVILIEQAFSGPDLSDFIQELGECVLFIDEFGKKFIDDEGEQGSLLGLFDGTGQGRRLVLLTENRYHDINQYMLNRPGRIHYHFRHEKLEEEIVREFCEDSEIPENVIEQICLRRASAREFSFDVLQAIVREYQLFGGDITELCNELNIEEPYDFTSVELDVLSIWDATLNVERTLDPHLGNPNFPKGHKDGVVHLVDLNDPEDHDSARIGVENIVKKEGEIYTFAFQCYGHDIILKGKQNTKTPLWKSDLF